jgi:hypothetical protein
MRGSPRWSVTSSALAPVIDRRGLVAEHAVTLREADPQSPLSVGNGEVCFTVDSTGLQTWPERYPVRDPAGGPPGTLLSTLSNWGWHATPGGESFDVAHCTRRYQTARGSVRYVDLSRELGAPDAGQITAEEAWLRGNPHRLHLLTMGFVTTPGWHAPAAEAVLAGTVSAGSGEAPAQRLDLWTGVIDSGFRLCGETVAVRTVCHPARDIIAVRVESRLLPAGRLAIRLAFPYGSAGWNAGADWTRPSSHLTTLSRAEGGWLIRRSLDGTASYSAAMKVSAGGTVTSCAPHEVAVSTTAAVLELAVELRPGGGHGTGDGGRIAVSHGFAQVEQAAREHWPRFWSRGGAVDVTGSTDSRAAELQRRIILSQYLTAINCAGSLPPQETGLTCNSWSGRFHLEMHWWHSAHFALWGRADLLERSLGWYAGALPAARRTAAQQGYEGARWPKQCGPDGRETPSSIGPFLLWQQPHPIYLAELARRASGRPAEVTARYADLVWETARFLADFPDRTARGFELGPPLVPAQECYAADRARLANPAFELAYWAWALRVAERWAADLGREPDARWRTVADRLVRPAIRGGVYAAVSTPPFTLRSDHPSMLCGYGFVPPTTLIDGRVMRATLHSVLADWDWPSCWGWDFPAIAMCAARLGQPRLAVDALLMDVGKNQFLASGHNRQDASLPVYLPANGGLLAAVALMAGGPGGRASGFPDDGSWRVEHEGLTHIE